LPFDCDPITDPDCAHKGMDDPMARFRIAFDQALPDDFSKPFYCRRRNTSWPAFELLSKRRNVRV
jgi:hypothetical protein